MPDDHASSPRQRRPEPGLPARRVRVLLPLPLPEALDYLAPEGSAPPEPGAFVRVPLGQRSLAGVVWDGARRRSSGRAAETDPRELPAPRAAAGAAALYRARRRLHDGAARRGAAHGDEHSRGAAAAAPAAALLAFPPPAPRPSQIRQAGCVCRRPGSACWRCRATGRRGQRPSLPGSPAAAPVSFATWLRPGSSKSDSPRPSRPLIEAPDWRLSGPALSPDQSIAAQRLVETRRGGQVRRDRARRRHRVGQDRDLFCRAGGGARRRTAGLGAAAGDRARRAVARALPRALRRPSGAMALGHLPSRAPRHLAGGCRRPGAGRRRRPLGAVPAFRRARPDHRRRGARPLLQAG